MTTTRVDEGGLHDADDDLPDVSLPSPLTPFASPGCTSQLRATYALDNSEGEKLTLLGELLKLIVLLE